MIIRFLDFSSILELRRTSKTNLTLSEDSVLTRNIFRYQNNKYKEHIEYYIPNFEDKLTETLALNFIHPLPRKIFFVKAYIWTFAMAPKMSSLEVFKSGYTPITSSNNFFVREAEMKAQYILLSKYEKKQLRWRAKLATLVATKTGGYQYTPNWQQL